MHRRLLLLLFAVPSFAPAQPSDPPAYFPLDVGNTWTYFQVFEVPDMPPDTSWRGIYTVSESVSINDTLYYVAGHPFAFADTLRTDEAGRIWGRLYGRDVLVFDFTLDEGASYEFRTPRAPNLRYNVTVSQDRTVKVGAGRFEGTLTLLFDDPLVLDEGSSYTFAPGVGIVEAYGGWQEYSELFSAEIGGQVITSLEANDASGTPAERAVAYPNPFSTSTTLVVPLSGATRPRSVVRAVVYDVLGREQATLRADACLGNRCTFEWDGLGASSGAYFVRILQDGHADTIKIILRR